MQKIFMILTNLFRPDVRVFKEAKYLVENGFEVEILCWDRKNEFIDKPYEIIDGIKIKRFYPYSEPGTGLKQLKSYLKFIKACKKYIKNKTYEYLHCHDLDGMIAGYLIKSKKSKIIFDMHEYYEAKKNSVFSKHLTRFLINFLQSKSNYIIYVNSAQKKFIKKSNQNKLIFLPNYPLKKDFIGSEDKIHSDNLRISYIGVVRQFNQLKNLMEACKDFKNVIVYIHGGGVALEKLKKIQKNYQNVFITGAYHYSKSSELYKNTDISFIVYPMNNFQNYIAEPVKYFEAIITKTPFIVSSKMKLSSFVSEKNIGFTIDENNVDEIKTLLNNILKNRNLLNIKYDNLKKIQHFYKWEEVVKNLNQIYYDQPTKI